MKKILVLQMRPEDEAANSEFEAILRVGEIDRKHVHRIRLEQPEIPNVSIDNYCAIIAGGSPFDVSCPEAKKKRCAETSRSFF